jgi:hypothetical protein
VQGALSPLPDWKGDVLVYSSQQVWFKKYSIFDECRMLYRSARRVKSVIFEVPSDGIDGTEAEQLSTDDHRR